MLEEDIDQVVQSETGAPEAKEGSAGLEEYKRAKEQLSQFLQKKSPVSVPEAKEISGEDKPKEDPEETDALEDQSEEYYARFNQEDKSGYETAYDELVDMFTTMSRKKDLDGE